MIIKFITIIKMDYQELSEKFLPIFYFHKDEKYFPISIDEYLNETVLVNQNNETIEKNVTTDMMKNTHPQNNLRLINTGRNTKPENITIYSNVIEHQDCYYITYYLLFFNNIGYKIGFFKGVGEHLYDLEHLTLRVDKNLMLQDVFISAHSDGELRKPKDLKWVDDRFIIYVAKNSHALSNRTGTIYRVWFLANDKCSKDIKFLKQDCKLIGKKDTWVYFKGKMSQEGGSMIGRRSYFKEPWTEKQEMSRLQKIFRLK